MRLISTVLLFMIISFPTVAKLQDSDKEIYKAAFRALDAKQYIKTRKIIKDAKDPLLSKAIRWMIYKAPNSGATFWEVSQFVENNPDWPLINTLRRRVEEIIPADLDNQEVLAWFTKYPPLTLDGQMRYSDVLIQAGQVEKAKEIVKKSWIDRFFTRRRERQFLGKFKKLLTRADHEDRLERLLWDRHTRSAQRMLPRVSKNKKAVAQARIALYRRAGNVDALIAKVPQNLRNDAGLMFERMQWRRRKKKNQGAQEILLNPPVDPVYPKSWWRERNHQVRRALDKKQYKLAYKLASGHQQTQGAPLAEAEFLSGWIALTYLNDAQLALPHFEKLYRNVSYPVSASRGAYWAGRAAAEAGKQRTARRWFRSAAAHTTTFYGQLAYVELYKDAKLNLPSQPPISRRDTRNFRNNELVEVVNQLAEIKQAKRADSFLLYLARQESTPGTKGLAAMLARSVERFDLSVSIARRALKQKSPLILEGYPVVEIKRADGAEKALVNSIIRQESNFKPTAKSVAGARGLMQLMPFTARKMARKLKKRYTRAKLTQDPHYNVMLGHTYLDTLLKSYDGSYVLTLAAYNAGPGRVSRWIKQNGDPRKGEDVVNWIEKIPFTETRNYVQRVLENLAVYRTRTQEFPFDRKEFALKLEKQDTTTKQAWNSYINDVAWTHKPN